MYILRSKIIYQQYTPKMLQEEVSKSIYNVQCHLQNHVIF